MHCKREITPDGAYFGCPWRCCAQRGDAESMPWQSLAWVCELTTDQLGGGAHAGPAALAMCEPEGGDACAAVEEHAPARKFTIACATGSRVGKVSLLYSPCLSPRLASAVAPAKVRMPMDATMPAAA